MKQNENSSQYVDPILSEIKRERTWDEICEQVGKPRFIPDKGVWGLSRTEEQQYCRSKD